MLIYLYFKKIQSSKHRKYLGFVVICVFFSFHYAIFHFSLFQPDPAHLLSNACRALAVSIVRILA